MSLHESQNALRVGITLSSFKIWLMSFRTCSSLEVSYKVCSFHVLAYNLIRVTSILLLLLLRSFYVAPLQGDLLRSAPSPTTAKKSSFQVCKKQGRVIDSYISIKVYLITGNNRFNQDF